MEVEMMEWREVLGFPGYEVNRDGEIRSWRMKARPGVKTRRDIPLILRSWKCRGYPAVHLCRRPGRPETKLVHRLVLEAFLGEQPEGCEACHNNGKPDDPRLCNLRWDTRVANMADKIKHGTALRGSRSLKAKLTEEQVLQIRDDNRSDVAIARELGVDDSTIWRARSGNTWGWLT